MFECYHVTHYCVNRCNLTHLCVFSIVRTMSPNEEADKTKQQIGARVDFELITEVRILALRQRRRFNELIEEALQDLLKKHREKKKP